MKVHSFKSKQSLNDYHKESGTYIDLQNLRSEFHITLTKHHIIEAKKKTRESFLFLFVTTGNVFYADVWVLCSASLCTWLQ